MDDSRSRSTARKRDAPDVSTRGRLRHDEGMRPTNGVLRRRARAPRERLRRARDFSLAQARMSAVRIKLGAMAALSATLCAEDARAYDATVDATFDAQFYVVPSPFGSPVVRRRRYTETLSLRVYGLEGKYDPKGPELFAV